MSSLFSKKKETTDKKEPLMPKPHTSSSVSTAKHANTYAWPNLVDESREMLEGAILIYAFADLRALARKDKLSDPSTKDILMNLPITVGDVMQVLSGNKEALRKAFGEDEVNFYLAALESIQASQRKQEVSVETGEVVMLSSQLVVFDDSNSREELVYGIAVNSARRRITVAFRGSVTTKDFMTDANSFLSEIPNPVKPESRETVGIHHGFYDYLFGKRSTKGSIKGSTKGNKCDVIMGQLVRLFEQYPDYRLYVTGHSLGGALSTLLAFEAAASTNKHIPKPVTCISVASPKCGNIKFRDAFQSLEKAGMVRCLRIANYKDLVTLLPDRGSFSCAYIMCCQRNVYRHVGLELKLYQNGNHDISNAQENVGYFRQLLRDKKKQFKHAVVMMLTLPFVCCFREDFLTYHTCKEYMVRFNKFAGTSGPENLSLNELYQNKQNLQTSEDS